MRWPIKSLTCSNALARFGDNSDDDYDGSSSIVVVVIIRVFTEEQQAWRLGLVAINFALFYLTVLNSKTQHVRVPPSPARGPITSADSSPIVPRTAWAVSIVYEWELVPRLGFRLYLPVDRSHICCVWRRWWAGDGGGGGGGSPGGEGAGEVGADPLLRQVPAQAHRPLQGGPRLLRRRLALRPHLRRRHRLRESGTSSFQFSITAAPFAGYLRFSCGWCSLTVPSAARAFAGGHDLVHGQRRRWLHGGDHHAGLHQGMVAMHF
jgi:hypothetical protein